LDALRSNDVPLRRFAVSLVGLVPGREASRAFAEAAESLPVDDRVLVLRALGDRGDTTAADPVAAATSAEDPEVRMAALEALGKIGDASADEALDEAAADADGMEQRVARAALKSLPAPGTDDWLLKSLGGADGPVRVELIRALAARGVRAAVDRLMQSTSDQDPGVRQAAIAAVGSLAGQQHLEGLVALVAGERTAEDAEALIDAIGRVFARVDDKSRSAEAVLARAADAPATARPRYLRLLGKTGAPEALPAIRKALEEDDPKVREAVAIALAEWPQASVSEDLLRLLTDPDYAAHRQTVLDGYLRLAAQTQDPGQMVIRALEHVDDLAGRKAVLEALGLRAESPQAMDVALRYLDDRDLRAAAGVATLRIAHRLRNREESRARSALQEVLAKVDHPDVQQRAQEVLNELDKYEDHILEWMTCGPFQEAGKDGAAIYREVFPPETNPEEAEWKPLTKGIGSWEVNLEATYGGLDFVAAYLRTRVWSDREQAVRLEMGSDDGIKAWLNGELLYDQWGEGGAAPRQKLVETRLQQGWNDLMLKVVDQRGGWVGACRIRKPDGTALDGLKVKAD
jgi:HEAT repeat protein